MGEGTKDPCPHTEELSEHAGIGLESNFVDVKDTERGFYRDMSRTPVGPLLTGTGALVTAGMYKAGEFNIFFPSVLTSMICHQEYQSSQTSGKVWSKENLLQ